MAKVITDIPAPTQVSPTGGNETSVVHLPPGPAPNVHGVPSTPSGTGKNG
jgi:hypothetical protein